MRNAKSYKPLLFLLLTGWGLLFLRCESTEKSMVRAVYLAQTAEASHVAIPVLKSEDTAYLDALNTAIEELRADGTLKTLSEKYFGQDISSEN